MTFEEVFVNHVIWTAQTFPKGTSIGAMLHLQRECNEVITDIENSAPKQQLIEEYADCIGCLMDSINREQITLKEVIEAWDKKLQKNKGRTWKDNGDGSYSHVKQPQQ